MTPFPSRVVASYMARLFLVRTFAITFTLLFILQALDLLSETGKILEQPGNGQAEVLRYVGAIEDASEHPIAKAIAAGARAEIGDFPVVESFANVEGLGVQGVVDGRAVVAGRIRFLADWGLQPDGDLATAVFDSFPADTVEPSGREELLIEVVVTDTDGVRHSVAGPVVELLDCPT